MPVDEDLWGWWRAALEGRPEPIYESRPQQGYYRKKERNGSFLPVIIWKSQKDGIHRAWIGFAGDETKLIGDTEAGFAKICEIWSWVAKFPISEAAYKRAYKEGVWHEAEVVAASNNPPEDDEDRTPLERITAEIDALAETAEAILAKPVLNQADADQAAIWSKKMQDAQNKADAQFDAEKAPLLEASRACDDAWRGPRTKAESLKKKLKSHGAAFLIAEKARLDREAEAKRLEAERQRQEAIRLAQAAQEAEGEDASEANRKAVEALAQAQASAQAAEPQRASAGRVGARVSLVTRVRAVIEDYDKALVALKDAPEVKEAIQQAAARMVRNKIAVDGVRAEEYQEAR